MDRERRAALGARINPGNDLAALQIEALATQPQHRIPAQAKAAAIGKLHLHPPGLLGAQYGVVGDDLTKAGRAFATLGRLDESRLAGHVHHPGSRGCRLQGNDAEHHRTGKCQSNPS